MRLYLALAVLMLALVAYADAQEDVSIQERFEMFGDKVADLSRTIAAKTQAAFEDLHNSDAVVKARNWFTEKFEQMKDSIQGQ